MLLSSRSGYCKKCETLRRQEEEKRHKEEERNQKLAKKAEEQHVSKGLLTKEWLRNIITQNMDSIKSAANEQFQLSDASVGLSYNDVVYIIAFIDVPLKDMSGAVNVYAYMMLFKNKTPFDSVLYIKNNSDKEVEFPNYYSCNYDIVDQTSSSRYPHFDRILDEACKCYKEQNGVYPKYFFAK